MLAQLERAKFTKQTKASLDAKLLRVRCNVDVNFGAQRSHINVNLRARLFWS